MNITNKEIVDDLTEDQGHRCEKDPFICFRIIGDSRLILDARKNVPIFVLVCPFCGGT
jgi:hypothetical protein